MKTDVFPVNYFTNIWTPKRIFRSRKQFKWWQIIIVFLFLHGLMMIPISLHYATKDTFPIRAYYPKTMGFIDDEIVLLLQDVKVVEGRLIGGVPFQREKEDGIVAFGLSEQEAREFLDYEYALLFLDDHFIIKEGDHPVSYIPYTKSFSLHGVQTVDEFHEVLSRAWLIPNKVYFVSSLTLITGTIIFISTLFIVFGSALFLYFTKAGNVSSIRSFKEAITIIVNCLGIPTFAAMIAGIIHFNVIAMIMMQTIGLIFILLAVFFTTQLKDEKANDNV